MFHHIVAFRFKDATPPESVTAIAHGLLAFAPDLPGTQAYHCGSDAPALVGAAPGGQRWDFAVAATFVDRAAYQAYADHPEHVRVRDTMIVPLLADRALVQFES